MQKHGPPYLPVTASQRSEARQLAEKRAAYYDVVDTRPGAGYSPMSGLLALLRAAYMLHQTAHWQTHGGGYYGDHIMLQRIYEESLEGIDGTAERLIGLSSDLAAVCPLKQIQLMEAMIMAFVPDVKTPAMHEPDALIKRSLDVESVILKVIKEVKATIEASGDLTEGLDDMLQSLASKHEEFVYLLKQRDSYTYDRR